MGGGLFFLAIKGKGFDNSELGDFIKRVHVKAVWAFFGSWI